MTKNLANKKRRTRKSPPDLRHVGYTDPVPASSQGTKPHRPTIDQFRELAKRHGIEHADSVAEKLDEAWYWWQVDHAEGLPPKGSDVRKLLDETSRRATLLQEVLTNMDASTRQSIRQLDRRIDLRLIQRRLDWLARAAKDAKQTIPRSPAGSPGRHTVFNLLCSIRRIYVGALGKNASRISRTDVFGGRFFEFARDVMDIFSAPTLSEAALGKQLQRAIKKVDADPSRQSMP